MRDNNEKLSKAEKWELFKKRHLWFAIFLLVIIGLISACSDRRRELEKQGHFDSISRPCTVLAATQEGEDNSDYKLHLRCEGHEKSISVTPATYQKGKDNIGKTMYFSFSDSALDSDDTYCLYLLLNSIGIPIFLILLGITADEYSYYDSKSERKFDYHMRWDMALILLVVGIVSFFHSVCLLW